MKNAYTLLLIALTFINSKMGYCQTQKGSFYIGGTGSAANLFQGEDNKGTYQKTFTQYNFTGGINAGYFIKDKLAIGISGEYNSVLNRTPANTPITNGLTNVSCRRPISVLLHVRRYHMILPNFGFYPQVSGGIVTGLSREMLETESKSLLLLAEGKLTGYTANVGVGFTWFPFKKAKRFNIETYVNIFGFRHIKNDYNDPSTRNTQIANTFSFFNTSVGINYFIFKQANTQ